MRRVAAAACAAVAVIASSAARLGAQSTMTNVYTSLVTTANASHLNAGAVVVGYSDVSVTVCGRNFCRVRVSAASPPSGNVLVFITAAQNAATPAASACNTATVVTTAQSLSPVLTVTQGNTGAARVFFCYRTSWLTAPTTYSPSVTFTLTHSNS